MQQYFLLCGSIHERDNKDTKYITSVLLRKIPRFLLIHMTNSKKTGLLFYHNKENIFWWIAIKVLRDQHI